MEGGDEEVWGWEVGVGGSQGRRGGEVEMGVEVSVGRRWKWGGEREGKGGGMCMHIYVHLLQRKSAAARGSEVFRAEAHRVAVAPRVGVGRGMI